MTNSRREFIVVFGKSTHWSSRFLNKNISHVQVISLHNGFWLRLNPLPNGLDTDVTAYNDETLSMIRKMDDIRALKITLHATTSYFARFGFMTCTDVAQYIMGLHFKFCWTPYSLYKKLLRNRDGLIYIETIR